MDGQALIPALIWLLLNWFSNALADRRVDLFHAARHGAVEVHVRNDAIQYLEELLKETRRHNEQLERVRSARMTASPASSGGAVDA